MANITSVADNAAGLAMMSSPGQVALQTMQNNLSSFYSNISTTAIQMFDGLRTQLAPMLTDAANAAQSVFNNFNSNINIYQINTLGDISAASSTMQAYIMAHPEIHSGYKDGTIDLPSHWEFNDSIEGTGFRNPVYRQATQGMLCSTNGQIDGTDRMSIRVWADGLQEPLTLKDKSFICDAYQLIDAAYVNDVEIFE